MFLYLTPIYSLCHISSLMTGTASRKLPVMFNYPSSPKHPSFILEDNTVHSHPRLQEGKIGLVITGPGRWNPATTKNKFFFFFCMKISSEDIIGISVEVVSVIMFFQFTYVLPTPTIPLISTKLFDHVGMIGNQSTKTYWDTSLDRKIDVFIMRK